MLSLFRFLFPDDVLAKPDDMNDDLSKTIRDLEAGDSSPQASSSGEKLFGSESFEKTAEELMQHRKRKHSNRLVQEKIISVSSLFSLNTRLKLVNNIAVAYLYYRSYHSHHMNERKGEYLNSTLSCKKVALKTVA